jgi:RNA polymerase sigma-70 factor (ECF subfamily)
MTDHLVAPTGEPGVPSVAIERQLQQWSRLIASCAARAGIQDADREELVQDVRIRVWKALDREKSPALPSSYMYRLVTSAAVDYLRRRRSRRSDRHLQLERAETVASPASTTDDELARVLAEALGTLAPDRRIAVRLHLEGKSLETIAMLLDWTPARARNLLYRGLDEVKSFLGDG